MTWAGNERRLWPYPFGMTETPAWVMPWLTPGTVARQALAAMPYPLRACETGFTFDPDSFEGYGDDYLLVEGAAKKRIRAVEKSMRDLGERLEWRFERIWALDEESTPEEVAAYEKSAKPVAGRYINPRCLDDYVIHAYQLMESIGMHEDNPDWELGTDTKSATVYQDALDWAQAAVVVLQQSLPWPFTGVLPYPQIDNRPVHRALFAYALLLDAKSKRNAKPWFRAMLYMNPEDNMGARYQL